MTAQRNRKAGDPVRFVYRIVDTGAAAEPMTFEIELDPVTLEHVQRWEGEIPDWALADDERCKNCSLPESERYCLAAKAMVPLVHSFEELVSHSEVDVTVETPERTYTKRTTAQRALSSILGLHLATSGCPTLGKLKPMARFHLPFSTSEETFFRSAGAWLLMNFIAEQKGEDASFNLESLHELYEEIHNINMSIAHRLRNELKSDASLNAITLLDILAQGMPMSIEGDMKDLEYVYRAMQHRPGSAES